MGEAIAVISGKGGNGQNDRLRDRCRVLGSLRQARAVH